MNLKQIKKIVTISEGNSKLGTLPSVSLPPIVTCNRAAGCTKGGCYALNGFFRMPSVKMAYKKNLESFTRNSDLYFNAIDNWLKIKRPVFFRWHVAGDIPNKTYLDGMIAIAKKHKKIKFLAFTKKYNLLKYTIKQKNLAIIISSWPGLKLPGYKLPIAFMQDGNENRVNNAIECPGNCETCGMCWNLKRLNKNVVFYKH